MHAVAADIYGPAVDHLRLAFDVGCGGGRHLREEHNRDCDAKSQNFLPPWIVKQQRKTGIV
jgi:hypothetical protein